MLSQLSYAPKRLFLGDLLIIAQPKCFVKPFFKSFLKKFFGMDFAVKILEAVAIIAQLFPDVKHFFLIFLRFFRMPTLFAS